MQIIMYGKRLARVRFSLWCTLKLKKQKSQKVSIGMGGIKRRNDCKARQYSRAIHNTHILNS